MKDESKKIILQAGKRYTFPAVIPSEKEDISALFTGEYDSRNGNAILMTRYGERWSVPPENCTPEQHHSKKDRQNRKERKK